MTRPTWDEYFMAMAYLASTRSTDRDTRHGAVIVNQRRHVIATGYNGFPRGLPDHVYPDTRPGKYDVMVHAEANALVNCEGLTGGAVLYVTGCPCPPCMAMAINAGIRRVVTGTVKSECVDEARAELTRRMAKDCLIQFETLAGEVGGLMARIGDLVRR